MPNHRTPTVFLLTALLAGGACAGIASAQVTFEFTNSGQALGNSQSTSVALGDLDGDGDLDAIVANFGNQPNTVWTNDGNGTFTNSGQALGNSQSYSVALGDLDGDGDLDAIVANNYHNPNTVWLNDGNGTFTDSWQILGNSYSTSVALGDLDGDGDLDAVFANDLGQANTVRINDGNGNFTTKSGQSLGNSDSTSVALGDLDGDGDLDAMFTNFGQTDTVWTNDGEGTFTNSGQALGNSTSFSVDLGDLDGDGDLDAMVANFTDPNTVWTNDGNGTFTNSGQTLGNSNINSISVALGDLDSDGDLDAMVANYNNQPNIVWTNDGNGTFTNSGQALGNSNSYSVGLGDLDGDGDLDAMVGNCCNEPNTVWNNDASEASDVLNQTTGVWYDSAREAIAAAVANDHLQLWGGSFNLAGVIDARNRPLTFRAAFPVTFGEDLLFMAGDGSSFLGLSGNEAGYVIAGRVIAPESGSLIFSTLDLLPGGELLQNDAFLIGYSEITNGAGTCYLKGELSAESTSTGIDGVNYVANDTDIYGDYVNAGSTIIQRGTLYIYGDLTNTGTMTGDFNNGFMGGAGPEEGDGYSIGGAYTIGSEASLVLPEPIWKLSVGGNLDIAINDPARFAMAQATIELNGLAPGTEQTLETLSADLGASESGFASSNFPIGTLRVASGSNTVLVNEHVNSTDSPCEVLYVDRLVVEAGASLTTAGCRIYTNEAILNGTIENADDIIVITDCPADLNGDGFVNGLDLAIMLGAWGSSDATADFNGDGTVDGQDLAALLAAWGLPCDE